MGEQTTDEEVLASLTLDEFSRFAIRNSGEPLCHVTWFAFVTPDMCQYKYRIYDSAEIYGYVSTSRLIEWLRRDG